MKPNFRNPCNEMPEKNVTKIINLDVMCKML